LFCFGVAVRRCRAVKGSGRERLRKREGEGGVGGTVVALWGSESFVVKRSCQAQLVERQTLDAAGAGKTVRWQSETYAQGRCPRVTTRLALDG
jgi:hypothetical protein